MKRKINRLFAVILAFSVLMCTMLVAVSAAVKPATPKVATENGLDGVQVSWNAIDGAVKYNVYRRQGGSNEWLIVGSTTDTKFVDKEVASGIYYVYSVRAYNDEGVYSDFISANTQTRKYMAVPKLTSISNATDGLYIKWNAVAGVTNGYRVYRRGAGSTYWSYLGTTKNLYYTDTAVKNNSGEYFRYTVIADGGYHSKFDTTGLYLRRLANPSSIKAAVLLDGVSVTWGAVKGSLSYNVYRRAAGQSSWTLLANVKTTSYKDTKVTNNQFYKYTVRAVCGSVMSSYNDGVLTKFMKAPVISGHTASTSNVTVSWNAIAGATAYRVYRRGAGEGWKLVATVSAASYTDKNVTKNAYYRYTIRSVSGNYVSGYDNNGYLLQFKLQSKPSTKNDIVAYYNNVVNNAKKNASNVVLNEVETKNYNGICYGPNVTQEMASAFTSALTTHEFPDEIYSSSELIPSGLTCNINPSKVKSATITESGNNYIVTLVFGAQSNTYRNDGGIGSAVNIATEEELMADSSTASLLKSVDVKYDGAKVEAVVNKTTGKLVKLTTNADCILDMNMVSVGQMVFGLSEKYVFTVNY